MYTLFCFIVAVIVYAGLVIIDRKRKERIMKPSKEELEVLSLILNQKEFFKTLNFLLMYGIITYDEYLKIELKSLPFLKE
jgi:hypothetical protein